MRLQSDIKITIKNKVIGGPDFLICMPLLATEKSDLFKESATIKGLIPIYWNGVSTLMTMSRISTTAWTPLRNCGPSQRYPSCFYL